MKAGVGPCLTAAPGRLFAHRLAADKDADDRAGRNRAPEAAVVRCASVVAEQEVLTAGDANRGGEVAIHIVAARRNEWLRAGDSIDDGPACLNRYEITRPGDDPLEEYRARRFGDRSSTCLPRAGALPSGAADGRGRHGSLRSAKDDDLSDLQRQTGLGRHAPTDRQGRLHRAGCNSVVVHRVVQDQQRDHDHQAQSQQHRHRIPATDWSAERGRRGAINRRVIVRRRGRGCFGHTTVIGTGACVLECISRFAGPSVSRRRRART